MPEISLFNDLKRHSILCEVLFLCLFHIQLCNVQGAAELSLTLLWITIFFEKKKKGYFMIVIASVQVSEYQRYKILKKAKAQWTQEMSIPFPKS